MKKVIKFIIPIIVASLVWSTNASALNKAETNALIEKYIKENPNVILESLRTYQKEQKDAAATKALKDSFANPVAIDVGDSPQLGSKNAPITIVEFSDFQCPYCGKSLPIIKEIYARNKSKVRLVFKHFPLTFHKKAFIAAKASYAAKRQGKFWEYHDKLLLSQQEWVGGDEEASIKIFKEYAKDLKLNLRKFNKDLTNPAFDKIITDDLKLGSTIKVGGTPTFFINGVKTYGALNVAQFQAIIDEVEKRGIKHKN